jgi:hypothetical protein
MFTGTKIVLAAALILGTASATLAGSENTEDRGGFVMPGSVVGVNPVYHPEIFGNVENAGNGSNAYGASPRKTSHSR